MVSGHPGRRAPLPLVLLQAQIDDVPLGAVQRLEPDRGPAAVVYAVDDDARPDAFLRMMFDCVVTSQECSVRHLLPRVFDKGEHVLN